MSTAVILPRLNVPERTFAETLDEDIFRKTSLLTSRKVFFYVGLTVRHELCV
jgi:hypothetical protein